MSLRSRIAAVLLLSALFLGIAGFDHVSRVLRAKFECLAQKIEDLTAKNITPLVFAEFHSSSALYWQKETARRFDDAVMIVVHGGNMRGQWHAFMDSGNIVRMDNLVRSVQAKHPGRFIVLVSCNWDGFRLPEDIKGVAYALNDVWMFPDAMSGINLDDAFRTSAVGDIFEFVVQ